MPKTATGKVQRRHVATAMIANEKNNLPESKPTPTASSQIEEVTNLNRFLTFGRSLISYVGNLCQGVLAFVQGSKKMKTVQ